MDGLGEEYEKLSKRDNLSGSLADVQKTIYMLTRARDLIAESKSTSSLGAASPMSSFGHAFPNNHCLLRSGFGLHYTRKAPEPCQAVV